MYAGTRGEGKAMPAPLRPGRCIGGFIIGNCLVHPAEICVILDAGLLPMVTDTFLSAMHSRSLISPARLQALLET